MSKSRSRDTRPNLLRSWLLNSGKHRAYATQDELMSLEAEAQKLDFPAPGPAQTPGDSAEHPILLIVDQRLTMRFGSGRTTKSVFAARTAAFLAWRALTLAKPVGLIVFDDQKILQFQPQCSRLRVRLILHALLNRNHAISPFASSGSNLARLNEALHRAERVASGEFLVCLVSDASGYNEETSRALDRLSRENLLLMALVYDPRQVATQGRYSFSAGRPRPSPQHPESPPGGRRRVRLDPFPPGVPIVRLNIRNDKIEQLHPLSEMLLGAAASHAQDWRSPALEPHGDPKITCDGLMTDWNGALSMGQGQTRSPGQQPS